MRVTSKGQVTIPLEIREKLGILPETEIEFSVRGDAGIFRKATVKKRRQSRGDRTVELLRGSGKRQMTTDEILGLMRGKE